MKGLWFIGLLIFSLPAFSQVHSDNASWNHVVRQMAVCADILELETRAMRASANLASIKVKRDGSSKSGAELITQFTNSSPGQVVTNDQLQDADDASVVIGELKAWLDEDPDGAGVRGTRRSDCERWQR